METPGTPCYPVFNRCCDKKKCALCGIIVVTVLFLVVVAFFLGKQLGLRQVPLCSPCPAQDRCPQAVVPSSTDPTAGWKTYKNEKLGLEIKYPEDVLFNEEQKGSDKLELGIQIKDMNNYTDEPMGFELKTAIADKKSLENGNYGVLILGADYPGARRVIKLNNVFMKTFITFREIEVCNVQFVRGVVFYKNNYQVRIVLGAPSTYANKLPDYFTLDSINCGNSPVWKSHEKFYSDLISNKAPKIALDWYNLFDSILSTLKFTDGQNDINTPGKENNFSGILRKTAPRPAPDIPYDYEIVFDKPLTGITTGRGDNQTIEKIAAGGSGLNLETYIGRHINFTATLDWGYAESRVLNITKIISYYQPATKITYNLPSGWKSASNVNKNFEVGYDPNQYDAKASESTVELIRKNLSDYPRYSANYVTFILKPYDNGSRHNFIEQQLGEKLSPVNKAANYSESEYLIQGKSCLVLDGISISQFPTNWGMCVVSPKQALLFTASSKETLSTLRFLQ